MSRSDQTDPWWIIAEFFEPHHDFRCEFNYGRSRWTYIRNPVMGGYLKVVDRAPSTACNLPAAPTRAMARQGWRINQGCVWIAKWPFRHRGSYARSSKEDRKLYCYGPMRAEARMYCTDELKRYRGGVESDPLQPDRMRMDWMPWD